MPILDSINTYILPSQSVSLKEKMKKPVKDGEKTWGQQCMDVLESIGRYQYQQNLKLMENYEMAKGKFIMNHYIEDEGFRNAISQLAAQYETPKHLRHYDIIGGIIDKMVSIWDARPNIFNIKQIDEDATNEYLRTKTQLLQSYISDNINKEIDARMGAMGINPIALQQELSNLSGQQQQQMQQQIGQKINQLKQQFTPPQIQEYMERDFLTEGEIWANWQLERDREYFDFREKEMNEFRDFLITDRTFRHFYLTPTGYNQETWHPRNVFYERSGLDERVENRSYIGRIFIQSVNNIIDNFGYLMTKEQIDDLLGDTKKETGTSISGGVNISDYAVPFEGYPGWNIMSQGIPILNPEANLDINLEPLMNGAPYGYRIVTQAYWRSMKKLIKITYLDEDTGLIIVKIVDENYAIPKEFKRSDNTFYDAHDLNTYAETYIDEIWKGIKISKGIGMTEEIYLSVCPNEYQGKGDSTMYGANHPVVGLAPAGLYGRWGNFFDMLIACQIGFNVTMNQLYEFMEKEIGMFMVFDMNILLTQKDWGGSDAFEKVMTFAKDLGMIPADLSPQNLKGSVSAQTGFLPKVINMDMSNMMMTRINIANSFRQLAFQQIGFNEGIQDKGQLLQNSGQTEPYFIRFANYVKRTMNYSLDIAKYAQASNPNLLINYTQDDGRKAFLNVAGSDLLMKDLSIFVSNSQEIAQQLQMMKSYAVQNTTKWENPADALEIIAENDPKLIIQRIRDNTNKMLQMQQQQQQAQDQAQAQQEQQKTQLEQQKIQSKEKIAFNHDQISLEGDKIKAGAYIVSKSPSDSPVQEDTSYLDDAKQQTLLSDANLKQQQLDLKKAQINQNNNLNQQKIMVANRKVDAQLQMQREKDANTARFMKQKQGKNSKANED